MRIHIIGLHGCGKTTLAHSISTKLAIPWFSLGVACRSARDGRPTVLPPAIARQVQRHNYSSVSLPVELREVVLKSIVTSNPDVVLDGFLVSPSDLEWVLRDHIIDLHCPKAVCDLRVMTRQLGGARMQSSGINPSIRDTQLPALREAAKTKCLYTEINAERSFNLVVFDALQAIGSKDNGEALCA
jgi:adenylate kinase family enzyme